MEKGKITFYGGVDMVTGANFLFEIAGKKIMIDCGFFQGCDVCDVKNHSSFPFSPSSIGVVFVTHAHMDHIGRIPLLVKEGFKGTIISTAPTKEIAQLLLIDGIHIARSEHNEGAAALYDENDVYAAMGKWKEVGYHERIPVADGVHARFRDAGHILGSGMVEIVREAEGSSPEKRLIFTGDLGNSPDPLLPDTESVKDADYLVMESVYGDRNHEGRESRTARLEDVIERVVRDKGILLIPAFSVERTQELLFEIKMMMEESKIPLIPVFLDSPLAIKVTELYKRYQEFFNDKVKELRKKEDSIFSFPQLHITRSSEESRSIERFGSPKIIIAGSGMSEGGRILRHERKYLGQKTTTILLIGYQAPNSLGRQIQDGVRKVRIEHEDVFVNARVETISGYSAHKDMDRLIAFVADAADRLKKVFVVMGEPRSSAFLTQRLRDYLGVPAHMPKEGEAVILDF
ncbi:MAG TPA: MBL fold metallo-hydrolase [Candidatus Paceibacterota bacterium]